MDIDDAALMYSGWGDEMLYGQQLARKITLLICEITNKSMGGKGIMKNSRKIWPLPGDDKKVKSSHLELLKTFKELDLKNGVTSVNKNKVKTVGIKEPPLVKKKNG
jgi:hypothetical protein